MPTLARRDHEAHVEAVGFVDGEAVFALADGRMDFNGLREIHGGGLLSATPTVDGRAMLSGGEDGRVCRVTASDIETVAEPGGWIDVLAAGPSGAVGFAAGRKAWLVEASGKTSEYRCERAIEGVAFAPKGQRLLCARYGGVSLFFAGNPSPVELAWDGAHTGVSMSPDGRFVVTTMQEPALHGWRIAGNGDPHMRMTGYPAKVRSLAWSAGGKWLATSGANSAVCWPFGGKGPQGRAPRELGARSDATVERVACHPIAEAIAVGYSDGAIALVKIEDGAEVQLRRASKAGEVTALAFDREGGRLAFGTTGGEAGVVTLA